MPYYPPVRPYPPAQCPGCGLWFKPRAVNAVYCTQVCANKVKRQRLKIAEPEYLMPPAGAQPAKPLPQAEVARLAPEFPKPNAGPTAEEALSALGYSSRRPSPEPTTPPLPVFAASGPLPPGTQPESVPVEPEPTNVDRLPCGHRQIAGTDRCPLCHPPMFDPEATA